MQALPDGSLYLRSAWTWPDIHSLVARSLVSVVDLVIWDMLVSHRYSSGTSLQRAPSAAALANSSAFSLPVVPVCAVCGTQRAVTSLSLLRAREQASMAAMAKRWPGPMVSILTLSIAVVKSEKTVYL